MIITNCVLLLAQTFLITILFSCSLPVTDYSLAAFGQLEVEFIRQLKTLDMPNFSIP